MSYAGVNPAILRLQMELMFWQFTITHRGANWVVDADYWSRSGINIHIDPLLAEYASLAQVLFKKYEPPSGEISPDTLPGFRRSSSLPSPTPSPVPCNMARIRELASPYYCNVPVQFCQDADLSPPTTLYNNIGSSAFALQRFNWIVFGLGNAHFRSSIITQNLPFSIDAVVDTTIVGRSLAQTYLKCANIFSDHTELLPYLRSLRPPSVHGYFIICPTLSDPPKQRSFLREQLSSIAEMKQRCGLTLVLLQIPSGYDVSIVSKFADKLHNVEWKTFSHSIQYADFDDCVHDGCTLLVAINTRVVSRPENLQLMHPPKTNQNINQYIYEPFNTVQYSVYQLDVDSPASLYTHIPSDDTPRSKSTARITMHIVPVDSTLPNKLGTNVHSRDYLAPPPSKIGMRIYLVNFLVSYSLSKIKNSSDPYPNLNM